MTDDITLTEGGDCGDVLKVASNCGGCCVDDGWVVIVDRGGREEERGVRDSTVIEAKPIAGEGVISEIAVVVVVIFLVLMV